MHKTPKDTYVDVVIKGLTVSKYKGEHHAKRIMMRAGLPVEFVNQVLLSKSQFKKDVKESD
jgi:hypothetical protein